MNWSEAALTVWGKLERETNSWLPLVRHLEDAAEMAGLVWDHFVPRSVKEYLACQLGISLAQVRALHCWYAGIHDLGKATNVFALQAPPMAAGVLDRMRDEGLITTPVNGDSIRHEVISQEVLADWLIEKFGMIPRQANTWAAVVGGHHGKNPTHGVATSVRQRPDAVGRGRWVDVRTEILEAMADRYGVGEILHGLGDRRMPVPTQTLMTSLVVVADWMSSDQELFPYGDARSSADRAQAALEDLGLPEPWSPSGPTLDSKDLLHARFPNLGGVPIRAIQATLVECARTCVQPPLLILEGPMGIGKTEGALLAAEILAARFGQGGVFIGLPTMATANPMFTRVLDWLGELIGEAAASVALAHGKAGLNDRYAGLLRQAWHGQVYDDEKEDRAAGPVVNGWLRGRRRAGLASFVVGTIDQGLFMGLKAKHVALRHLGLAGKVVVIDEVHAADTYMREYLKRVLTWLGAYRTPVILMSATLPPAQRDEYVAAYAAGRRGAKPHPTTQDDSYPRVTTYDGTLTESTAPHGSETVEVRLERIGDEPAVTVDLLRRQLAEGGCAGVICNTVSRAQELFRLLVAEFGSDVVLAHSRFIAPARADREGRLVAQLGRDGRRPERLVVVGTQVLEQSLDIDFDLMISDVSPMDLVLQRAGRLHRHRRSDRPLRVETPTLYLRGIQDWGAAPPTAVRGSRSVYGEAPLLRTLAVLQGLDRLVLPFDIPTLVRLAYDPSLPAPVGWDTAWAQAESWSRKHQAEAVRRASAYLLDEPFKLSNLTGWLDVQTADPERSEEQGRSQVRDSEDSLEVIALYREADGTLRLPPCAPRHPNAPIPEGLQWGTGADASLARAMATCTLSLPISMTNQGAIDPVLRALEKTVDYSGWQQSPWIQGQLVIAFDPAGHATVADFDLCYSAEIGLTVTQNRRTDDVPTII